MTSQKLLTVDNLTAREREIYDQVLRVAGESGRDRMMDVLVDTCPDAYHGARVAEVLGGRDAFWDFHARHTERQLAEPENQRTDSQLVRDMSNGRIGVVRAEHDGRQLVEFAGGTEVMAACDLQEVGPDPDVQARAKLAREAAERARDRAVLRPDPQVAARWQAADETERAADRLEASSMDWLADPGSVYGFQGPPAVDAQQRPAEAQAPRGAIDQRRDDPADRAAADERSWAQREAEMVAKAAQDGGILSANPATNADRYTMGCLLQSGVFELVEEPGQPSYVKLVGSAAATDDNDAHSDPADEPEPRQPASVTDPREQGVADGYAGGPYNEDLFADEEHGPAYRAGLQEGRTAAVDEELTARYAPEPTSPNTRDQTATADGRAAAEDAATAHGCDAEAGAASCAAADDDTDGM